MSHTSPLPTLSDVTTAEWNALAARRVFFGHQSVGANIIQGISQVLAAHPEIRLTVQEARDPRSMTRPAFYHAAVGRNYFPEEKAEEFAHIASGLNGTGSVGMVKFCFVDVETASDPVALFDAYQRRVSEVRAANPGITIVHITMPLWTDQGAFNYWKRRIRGYPNERGRNLIRNQYNALMHRAYDGTEPLFDLAALESTRPDGSRLSFRYAGETVFALAPELTDDGGHLNQAARTRVAEQLLVFLAKLPAGSPPGSSS